MDKTAAVTVDQAREILREYYEAKTVYDNALEALGAGPLGKRFHAAEDKLMELTIPILNHPRFSNLVMDDQQRIAALVTLFGAELFEPERSLEPSASFAG